MASWADEISAIIEKNIAGFGGSETETASVGTVIAVQDGIARVYGLQDVKYLELVEFPRTGIMGMAFNLEEETVSCPILGDYTHIQEDDEVRTTGRVISVPVGDALIGRVVDALGNPIDEAGEIVTDTYFSVERIAQGIIDAAKTVKLSVPLVVRLEGTNVKQGKQLLRESGLALITASDLADAAQKVVAAAATANPKSQIPSSK